jgi:glycosyltransferase involved in cell wall biosynthesis
MSWVGLIAHRLVGYIRRMLTARADVDSANIAVVCVGFLRYGSFQAAGLSETGLNVTLYYVDRSAVAENDQDRALILDHARAAGVELVAVPRRRNLTLLKDVLWLHRDLRRRRIASAVVQSHRDPRCSILGLLLPIALILHDPEPHSGGKVSELPARSRVISRAAELTSACLIVHSPRLLEQIRPLLRRLPVGVVAHGAEMAASPAPVPHERRLLIFGRLFAYKGVDTALDAFRALGPELSDIELIVAGRGPLANLARGVRNVEVRSEYVTESDFDALLRGVRLVLLPYKDATQSGVGLHALERGVPCIVSSVGGLPELVENVRATLVVPADDPVRLAQAIVANVDHDEGLRRSIYDYTETHFAWPVVAQRLREETQRLARS